MEFKQSSRGGLNGVVMEFKQSSRGGLKTSREHLLEHLESSGIKIMIEDLLYVSNVWEETETQTNKG